MNKEDITFSFDEDEPKGDPVEQELFADQENEPVIAADPNPELIIPMNLVEEFKYLSKGNYAQVLCAGIITERGMVVQNVKYVR